MSVSTPPPPTGSNTGVYAVVAILLLGGIGFFAWKSCQPPPPPPTLPVTTPSAPSATLKIDDIPLPPPEDAGAPETGPVTTKVAGPGPDPCSAKVCKGVASSELESALQFRAKQAHRCYDNALAADNTLQGKVTLNIKVGSNGSVCGVNVVSNELSNPAVPQCVANAFRATSGFPAPKGGCVEINLPINFKPGGR